MEARVGKLCFRSERVRWRRLVGYYGRCRPRAQTQDNLPCMEPQGIGHEAYTCKGFTMYHTCTQPISRTSHALVVLLQWQGLASERSCRRDLQEAREVT